MKYSVCFILLVAIQCNCNTLSTIDPNILCLFIHDQYNSTSVAEVRKYFTPAYILPWTNRSRNALSSPLRQGCTRQHYIKGRTRQHYVKGCSYVNITACQSLLLSGEPLSSLGRHSYGAPRRRAVHHSVLSCKRVASRCTLLYMSSIEYTPVNSSKYKSLCYLKCTASW